MNEERILRDRFSDFFRWERIKKRETKLIAVFFYSILAAVLILPAEPFLPPWIGSLSVALLCFLFFTAGVFLLRRWGNRDALRALFRLDKTLHLEERSMTAWELLNRKDKQPVDLLVLQEAEEGLRGIEPRSVLKRRLTWHAFAAPPLLVLWFLLLLFDVGSYFERSAEATRTLPLARKVKEYAQDLEEQAKTEGLEKSLKIARSLKEAAEKQTSGGMSERKLKESLSGVLNQIGKMGALQGDETDLFFPGLTRDGLLDLKAELEAMEHLLSMPGDAERQGSLEPELIERLSALPPLKGELDKGPSSVEQLGTEGLGRSVRRYEKGVKKELDRRALQRVEEFLGSLLAGDRMFAEEDELGSGLADEGGLFRSAESRKEGALPGRRPGAQTESSRSSPPVPERAVTQLKGMLGKGKRRSMIVRGGARGGQSGQISDEEIVTSYRRQAEEELASEKIPQGLKETVRRYFLSLGAGPNKNEERRSQ